MLAATHMPIVLEPDCLHCPMVTGLHKAAVQTCTQLLAMICLSVAK